MVLRRAVRLGLSLLVAAGFGVYARVATAAQSAAAKRTSSTSASSTKSKARKTSRKKKDKGQQAPTSDRISEIQTALGKDGSYKGTPSGKWDDSTVAAMRSFQGAHGLNPSGKLDARSLERLGLGSTTAGAGAPVIPPNSTSRLTSAVAQPERE